DSIIDSLHRIIYSQPAPLAESNPSAPAELQRMIRKCIAKDPNERYQSAKDIAIDLRALIIEMDSGSFVQVAPQRTGTNAGNTVPNLAGQQTAFGSAYVSDAALSSSPTIPSGALTPIKARLTPKVIAAAIGAALITFGLLYALIGMRHARSRLNTLFLN